jgi:hypothetical protein
MRQEFFYVVLPIITIGVEKIGHFSPALSLLIIYI